MLLLQALEKLILSDLREYAIGETRRLVIKVGSKLLVDFSEDPAKAGVKCSYIHQLTESISVLREMDIEVVLVSSGSVGAGMAELGITTSPKEREVRRACAAVGQVKLMHAYEQAFSDFGIHIGQVLLSADDFRNRERYMNIRFTINALLEQGCVPIINENDTIATAATQVGDNDKLSSDVTQFLDAQMLIIFTDEDGLYDKNPKTNDDAVVLEEILKVDESIINLAEGSKGSEISTGGMQTKLEALRQTTEAGCAAILANGSKVLPHELMKGLGAGSFFVAHKDRMPSRDRWLSFVSTPTGTIEIDQGAMEALRSDMPTSLLLVGVNSIQGLFRKGDLVDVIGPDGELVGRGTTNAESDTLLRMIKLPKEQRRTLPKRARIVINNNNLVIQND